MKHPQADQQFLLCKESFAGDASHLPVGILPPIPENQAQT